MKALEKWNTKWKAQRLQLLFTELSEEAKEFFSNLELLNAEEIIYPNGTNSYDAYNDTFNFAPSDLVTVEHRETKKRYYVGREVDNSKILPFDHIEGEWDFHYDMKKWHNILQTEEKENKAIHDFWNSFDFSEMIQDIVAEHAEGTLEKEKQTFTDLVCRGVEYNKQEKQYYLVFENGMKIPYKEETSLAIETY